MSEEQQSAIGERRRRREAERAAREAAGATDRPLTRRELRAREAALQSGALQVDSTGEMRVVERPEPTPRPAPDPLDQPATGHIGLTRRQLRALREQQEAAARGEPSASGTGATPSSAGSGATGGSAPSAASAASASSAAEPTSRPAPSAAPSAPTGPTPSGASGTSAPSSASAASAPSATSAARPPAGPAAPPAPTAGPPSSPPAPVRRPVVRPPAGAAGVRGLAQDGTGLLPVQRTQPQSAWAPADRASVDVTDAALRAIAPETPDDATPAPAEPAEPAGSAEPVKPAAPARVVPTIVADPGPLPTTRRSRRLAAENVPATEPPASLDEVIEGTTEEPEPFAATPSWAELPPPTPAAPLRAVEGQRQAEPAPATAPAEARADDPSFTEVISAVPGEDDRDEHRTPRWLTALMILVLVVIGLVLGALVWRLMMGEGDAGAAAAVGTALVGWWT